MTTTASTDAELLAQARRGDETAFAELYVRHESAARRLANSYARAGDPDDLVNGAFERVLQALRKGMGPTDAFRAYLFVTLRRLAADRIARSREAPHDEIPEPVRAEAPAGGLDPAERSLIVDAYASLPERWQTVLWHTAVEGRPPRDLAPTLGMSPNAAAALAYRAREKLRQAYLQAHLQATPRPECEPHRSRLGAYVRDGLGARDRGATEGHIDGCASCHGLVAELADVNRLLAGSLFPIFVRAGEVAAALAATTTTVTGTAAGGGVAALGRRTLSRARSNPAATSAVVGALLVLAVIAGALIASHDDQVALPSPPPSGQEAAPADDPEPLDVPLVVAPPERRAEPIASSSEPPPMSDAPTTAPAPAPTTSPPTSTPSPTTSSTRPSPPSSPPVPPGTEPPPTTPPSTTTPATTPPPPSDGPCQVHLRLGRILDVEICIDLDLPLLGRQSEGRGLKFSQ